MSQSPFHTGELNPFSAPELTQATKRLSYHLARLESLAKVCRDFYPCDEEAHLRGAICRRCEAKRIMTLASDPVV